MYYTPSLQKKKKKRNPTNKHQANKTLILTDIWAANKHMIIGYVVNSKFFVTYRGFTAEANGKGRGSLESQRHQSFGHSPVHFPG